MFSALACVSTMKYCAYVNFNVVSTKPVNILQVLLNREAVFGSAHVG